MILNHQFHQNEQAPTKTLVFVHGLFGSLSNLGMLAREFEGRPRFVRNLSKVILTL